MRNQVIELTGIVKTYPEVVSVKNGIEFFKMYLDVSRLSNNSDTLPITFSGASKAFDVLSSLEEQGKEIVGQIISIKGEVRTRNKKNDKRNKLEVTVLANEIVIEQENKCKNKVKVTGFIAKKLDIRDTPKGIKIVDAIIAINREDGSDYIPTVFWNSVAEDIHNEWNVGDKIELLGRMQSREYNKQIGTDEVGNPLIEVRTCYEMSVIKIFK